MQAMQYFAGIHDFYSKKNIKTETEIDDCNDQIDLEQKVEVHLGRKKTSKRRLLKLKKTRRPPFRETAATPRRRHRVG